jgi:hypothetical protein
LEDDATCVSPAAAAPTATATTTAAPPAPATSSTNSDAQYSTTQYRPSNAAQVVRCSVPGGIAAPPAIRSNDCRLQRLA